MSGGTNTYGRIWRTASGGYVGDGHLDAEILAVGPGGQLPDDFDPDTFEATGTPVPAEPEPEPAPVEEAAAPEAEAEAEAEAEPEPEAEPEAPPAKRGRK